MVTYFVLTLHLGQRPCNQELISCRKGSFSLVLYARHSGLVINSELGGSTTESDALRCRILPFSLFRSFQPTGMVCLSVFLFHLVAFPPLALVITLASRSKLSISRLIRYPRLWMALEIRVQVSVLWHYTAAFAANHVDLSWNFNLFETQNFSMSREKYRQLILRNATYFEFLLIDLSSSMKTQIINSMTNCWKNGIYFHLGLLYLRSELITVFITGTRFLIVAIIW